jgi:hypothetical protein
MKIEIHSIAVPIANPQSQEHLGQTVVRVSTQYLGMSSMGKGQNLT